MVDLNYNFECDWLIELSDYNLASELVEIAVLKPITIEEIVIFMINVRICPYFLAFLCNFFTFLNACISVKTSPINTKLEDFVNLGVLFLTMWINSC